MSFRTNLVRFLILNLFLFQQLQAEKEKATARINGLEDEIDGLKGRLRKLQDKADREVRASS